MNFSESFLSQRHSTSRLPAFSLAVPLFLHLCLLLWLPWFPTGPSTRSLPRSFPLSPGAFLLLTNLQFIPHIQSMHITVCMSSLSFHQDPELLKGRALSFASFCILSSGRWLWHTAGAS